MPGSITRPRPATARADTCSAHTEIKGAPKRFNLSKQQPASRVKPAGEWNTFEITCRGKDMTLWVNGAVTNQWHECEVKKGYVGLEAEGCRIEFRNVKVKSLDDDQLRQDREQRLTATSRSLHLSMIENTIVTSPGDHSRDPTILHLVRLPRGALRRFPRLERRSRSGPRCA